MSKKPVVALWSARPKSINCHQFVPSNGVNSVQRARSTHEDTPVFLKSIRNRSVRVLHGFYERGDTWINTEAGATDEDGQIHCRALVEVCV